MIFQDDRFSATQYLQLDYESFNRSFQIKSICYALLLAGWWKSALEINFAVQTPILIFFYFYYNSSDGKWIEADNWKSTNVEQFDKKTSGHEHSERA